MIEVNSKELPKSWCWVKLGEICRQIETKNPNIDPESEFDYIDIASIDNTLKKIISPKRYLGKDTPSRARKLVKKNDIVFSTVRTYLMNIALVPTSLDGQIASTGFCVIRVKKELNAKFVFYYSLSRQFVEPLNELQRGTSYPAVRDGDVFGQPFPLCASAEQHRIVEKIEELFSDLDKGIESLKTTQQQLKIYRQAVLKWAFDGRLTAKWREEKKQQGELKSADELLVQIKAEREKRDRTQLKEWNEAVKTWEANGKQGKKPGKPKPSKSFPLPTNLEIRQLPVIPDEWCWVKAETISEVVRGGSPRPAGDPKYFGGNIAWITVAELTKDEGIYLTQVKSFVTELGKDKSRYIQPGTLLLTNSGATLGVPKITKIGGCINDGSVALLYVLESVKSYLYWFLKSQTENLRSINQGAAQPNLNTTIVKNIVVPFCDYEEQQQIVEEIEFRLSICDRLEATITENLQRAEALRQSILKQAFEGKLVPQDPNDEPAGQLIERIKQEKLHSKNGQQLELEI